MQIELFFPDLLGKSKRGRIVQEIHTAWICAQEKRKDEIDLLEEIVLQYKGDGDLIQRVQQGKRSMQKRANTILQQIIALDQRVKEAHAHRDQEV